MSGPPTKKARRELDKEKEEQEQVWLEVFKIFDKDGNGRVSANEVGMLLRGLGMNPSQNDIDDAIKAIDTNGSPEAVAAVVEAVSGTGQIEFEEFADFMHHMKKNIVHDSDMENMIRAFKIFDYNNDDHIDANELKRVVTSMGDKLTIDEANQMVSVADIDEDGRINYKEFVKFILAPCL